MNKENNVDVDVTVSEIKKEIDVPVSEKKEDVITVPASEIKVENEKEDVIDVPMSAIKNDDDVPVSDEKEGVMDVPMPQQKQDVEVPVPEEKRDAYEKPEEACKGPNSLFIKLISKEGQEFFIQREYALYSGAIRSLLSGRARFREDETNSIHFVEISSIVMKEICDYLVFKHKHVNGQAEIPPFPIKPEIAMELMFAANFLDC